MNIHDLQIFSYHEECSVVFIVWIYIVCSLTKSYVWTFANYFTDPGVKHLYLNDFWKMLCIKCTYSALFFDYNDLCWTFRVL